MLKKTVGVLIHAAPQMRSCQQDSVGGLDMNVQASVCMCLSLYESVWTCVCACLFLFQSLSGSLRLWCVGVCACACVCAYVHKKARDQSQQLKNCCSGAIIHLVFKTGSLTGLR